MDGKFKPIHGASATAEGQEVLNAANAGAFVVHALPYHLRPYKSWKT
jgi:hypothetical protein